MQQEKGTEKVQSKMISHDKFKFTLKIQNNP